MSTAAAAPPIITERTITGMSAVLLAHSSPHDIDWDATVDHLHRTVSHGLAPAVNMDTGYVQLLGDNDRIAVLDRANEVAPGDYVAGAFVSDAAGDPFALDRYLAAIEEIVDRNGTPVIFPSHGLNALSDDDWAAAMAAIGERVDRFIGFELGSMFVPYGRIPSLDAYESLLAIPSCIGAKHSSLSRRAEWDRLALRDRVRPDFKVFTGNDLAIDMVMYGSDYLLGLSAFAPGEFALRDRLWAEGDPAFYELNDLLQYLGQFTFRPAVPGYRHNAAMFWKLRGWAASDATPDGAPRRPDSDVAVLANIVERLEEWSCGTRKSNG